MHLIQDENGNVISHGHEHNHGHEHSHEDHSHTHDDCNKECGGCEKDCDPKKEAQALLAYMLQHNEHHAAELDQMAANLEKLGMADSAKQIRDAVSDFQKGNMRLSLALTLVKEQMKGE